MSEVNNFVQPFYLKLRQQECSMTALSGLLALNRAIASWYGLTVSGVRYAFGRLL